ncbi:TPA: PIN domain-containing protein [Candidatus Bathyarchaeota archaeon]|nr:PIN domain-containing protein [Candidatus Bathyarchaeota archaeon]
MKFVDSNVFLHAFLIPRRSLTKEEQRIKDEAKRIVKKVEEGEDVATTVIHLSEVANIIEDGLGLRKSLGFLAWALTSENIKVFPVAAEDYEVGVSLARDNDVSANDALAYLFMNKNKIKEIYSFDKHFDKLKGIVKLP